MQRYLKGGDECKGKVLLPRLPCLGDSKRALGVAPAQDQPPRAPLAAARHVLVLRQVVVAVLAPRPGPYT